MFGEQRRAMKVRDDDSANFDFQRPTVPLGTFPSASPPPPFHSTHRVRHASTLCAGTASEGTA